MPFVDNNDFYVDQVRDITDGVEDVDTLEQMKSIIEQRIIVITEIEQVYTDGDEE